MMIEEFTARVADAQTLKELDTLLIALAEQRDGSGRNIEIQLGLSFDEQDVTSGMDTYCVVRGGRPHYGGIKAWSIKGSVLYIDLDQEAEKVLGVSGFRIELQVPKAKVEKVRSALRRVVGASSK